MLVSCLCAANLWAQSEVNVEQAGTLSTLLTSAGSMLKLTGTINGTDIKYLRQLTTDGPVMSLDISGVRIVSGGEAYYESYRTENDVIGQYMFWKCGRLRNVVLPPTVTSIGRCAFAYTALRKAEVPGSVQRLGYGAFSDCPSLSTVLIGSHVAHIEQGAFYNSAVTLVYLKPLSPPSLGPYIFTSKPTLRVYTVALEEYQQSSWAQYGTFMGRLENLYPLEDDGSARVNELRDTFFEDAACTRLRGEYQAMTDDELTAALSAAGMPDFMTPIALKLKNGGWAAYEQDFRIHDYPAYSDASYWNSLLRATGGSYMGNPTGIYVKDSEPLYVFVDDDVPSDATLYIAGCAENNLVTSARTGKKLARGLNIVDGQAGALYYIIYTADTKSKTKSLSQWPEMKIHIEGGTVNGYYDLSRHSDRDYQALLRAATHERFTVRGAQSLFHFKTATYRKVWPTSIDKSICWFDSLTVWEKELMGFCESVAVGQRAAAPYCLTGVESIFPQYYNNPNFAIQGEESSSGWANSSSYRTSYNSEGCISSSFVVTRDDHDDWCAAHECGHNNQGTITLAGGTEVSNNLFSNVVRFLTGRVTSDGSPLSTIMQEHAAHQPFFTRSLDSQMRMYYQLYLYYHQARRNTSFYPDLFCELRRDPLGGQYENAYESSLKFVRKVCQIAGEDLTDFFSAWGFFEPCSNLTINDYGTHSLTVRQAEIDRTLAEIAKYPRKNRTLLFVEDRVDYVPTFGFLATAGQQRRGSERVGQCGRLGQYTDFMPDAEVIPSSYTYLQTDTMFSMQGTGGVGFLVLNADGKMITASNAMSFSIPSSAIDDFSIYSVDADGTLHEALPGGSGAEVVWLNQAGTLRDSLSAQVVKAQVGGYINGTDIKYLRELISEGGLLALDLSEARILTGGDAYYENYRSTLNAMGSYAFYGCTNLISIQLPQKITSISDHAFTKTNLRELRIPNLVTSVGVESFGDCHQLSTVIVGTAVRSFGQGVFYNSGVRDVYVLRATPPTVGPYLFNSNPVIHVYAKSLSAYQKTDWAKYGTLVGDLDDYQDIITGVAPLPDVEEVAGRPAPVFDLMGRPVTRLQPRTIYIYKGKKFVTTP